MTQAHPFNVGGRYRNELGEYEVTGIDGPTMTVRYDSGSEARLKVAVQTRIWQRFQDEEESERIRFARGDVLDESLDTAPVKELVRRVMRARFSPPYSGDITDQVCQAIEADEGWLKEYWSLVDHFSSGGKNGRLTVNSSIGWWTKELTGMATVEFPVKARSKLIRSYSRLGYGGRGFV